MGYEGRNHCRKKVQPAELCFLSATVATVTPACTTKESILLFFFKTNFRIYKQKVKTFMNNLDFIRIKLHLVLRYKPPNESL